MTLQQELGSKPWFTAVHWLKYLLDTVPSEDFKVTPLEVPDGEDAKNTEWLLRIWKHLEARGFNRQDTIVALGGGALLSRMTLKYPLILLSATAKQ